MSDSRRRSRSIGPKAGVVASRVHEHNGVARGVLHRCLVGRVFDILIQRPVLLLEIVDRIPKIDLGPDEAVVVVRHVSRPQQVEIRTICGRRGGGRRVGARSRLAKPLGLGSVPQVRTAATASPVNHVVFVIAAPPDHLRVSFFRSEARELEPIVPCLCRLPTNFSGETCASKSSLDRPPRASQCG